MKNNFRDHDRVAMQIAKELENDGYSVILTPDAGCIPFSLEGYTPDLLASKGDDHLIVEIKTRESPEHPNRFRKVIEIIDKHPGWRFLIKTIADTVMEPKHVSSPVLPVATIETQLSKVESAIAAGLEELAIPYLWNAAIATLRHKAVETEIPADLSDRSLINQLYTMGELSRPDHENLTHWNQLRNFAVHAIPFKLDSGSVQAFEKYVKDLLNRVKQEQDSKAAKSGHADNMPTIS